jgi:hypothetical protein
MRSGQTLQARRDAHSGQAGTSRGAIEPVAFQSQKYDDVRENDYGDDKCWEEAQGKAKKCRHGGGIGKGQSRRCADNEEDVRKSKRIPDLIHRAIIRTQDQQNQSKRGHNNVTPPAQDGEGEWQLPALV